MKLFKSFGAYIKSNLTYFIILFFVLFISFVRLPYDVEMPGGTINLKDRIKIDDKKIPIKGSFNMAYVSVVQGNIPYIIGGLFVDDWDIVKSEDNLLPNENINDANKRNKLYLEQSKNAAIMAALKEADIEYTIKNKNNNILYIYDEAKTDLKVGDNIIECDGKVLESVDDIVKTVKESKVGDTLSLVVLRDNKRVNAKAEIVLLEDEKKLGIVSVTTYNIDSKKKIELDTTASESGSSGGLMMSLMIYSGLVNKDYTNGKKIVGTGTIDMDGNVGEIGGVKYKMIGAAKEKVDIFFVPSDNYEEALKIKNQRKYKFALVKVDTLREAIDYLEGDTVER